MKNITTYQARRTNVFTWLATIAMLASLVARIIFFAGAGARDVLVVVVHIILPAVANLIIAIKLPLRGEKFFYVTVRPYVLLAIYFISVVCSIGMGVAMTIACLVFCILQMILFVRTFTGKLDSTLPVLLSYLAFIALASFDRTFVYLFNIYFVKQFMRVLSDSLNVFGIICLILSARKLPKPKEGEPYRPRYGDRKDGRLIRTLPPMTKVMPYFLVTRNTASNSISDTVEVSSMEKYIHQKRREGYKHFGITHVFIAAYVRCCAELPALNRFLAGQKIYQRYTIDVNMVIKKDMEKNSPDTAIKVHFDRTDTAVDVYEKFDAALQKAKEPELNSNTDQFEKIVYAIPGLLLKFIVFSLRVIDYFGLLPNFLEELSPFHGSMFITSMGSLGIPPIYHHLYDFGNVAQFCAFGAKRTVKTFNDQGEVVTKRYVDYKWVTDERTVDGFYYAAVLKRMRSLLSHPEQLDEPAVVVEDIE